MRNGDIPVAEADLLETRIWVGRATPCAPWNVLMISIQQRTGAKQVRRQPDMIRLLKRFTMKRTITSLIAALVTTVVLSAAEPVIIPLWPNGAPGFEDKKNIPENAESYWVRNIHNPSITVFLPPKEKATGAAVLICPGGGHRELVFKAEGTQAAEFLAEQGVVAIALKYRLGREEGVPYKVDVHAKEDARRAMRVIRSHAREWGIDPQRVGIMGFSAGGEVVSMVTYDSGEGDPNAADPIDRLGYHPNFQIMIYPGPLGIPETIPADAPPAFLLVANDDRGASRVVASLFQKYRDARRPVEVHVLSKGGHGFNMGDRSKLKSVNTWPQRLADWLADNEYFQTATAE
jgi:acetyl esterase/lipase